MSTVTFVHPTQAIEIFSNVSTPFGTLAICDRPFGKDFTEIVPGEFLGRGVKPKRCRKCSDFGRFQGYISETVQDKR